MGSVKKRVDVDGRPGGWLARWREPDGTQRKRSFTTKREASRHLASVEAALSAGGYIKIDKGAMTVGAYFPEWLRAQVHLTPSSRSSQTSLWDSRVSQRWADVRFDRIEHRDVARWVADLSGQVSASRTRQAYFLIKALLDSAVADGRMARNPAENVPLPRLPKSGRRYLSHAEVATLADAAGPYRLVILTLAYCGLRWGELAGLTAASFVPGADPTRGTARLHVTMAYAEVRGRLILGEAKDHENRSVPVPGFLAEQLAAVVKGRQPDALIFTASRGGVLRHRNARRWFDAAVDVAGLAPLAPHELRHTAASLAVHSGADVIMVSRMLGHANPSMTLDRYGHLWNDGLDALAQRLHDVASAHHGPDSGPAAPQAAPAVIQFPGHDRSAAS